MICPKCQKSISDTTKQCYYCGTVISPEAVAKSVAQRPKEQTGSAMPTAVSIACKNFFRSPMMLFAVIAYTVFAGIYLVTMLPMLEYIDEIISLLKVSFLLTVTIVSAMLLFIPPLMISIGLWKMYNSEGREGTGSVRSGINFHLGLAISMYVSLFLLVVLTPGVGDILADSFGELILPLGCSIFCLVAVAKMRTVLEAVEYTSMSGKTNTDGVSTAAILLCIALGISLISFLKINESLNIASSLTASFGSARNAISTIGDLSHLLSYALFAALSLNFCKTVEVAEEQDARAEKECPKVPVQTPMYRPVQPAVQRPVQPAQNDATIAQLKQYKELLDSGVITQEDYDAKKKQLLGL